MIRLFFHTLEQAVGPLLNGLASIVYAAGLGALAVAALFPLYARWMEHLAMGYGLQQVWIMSCGHCHRTTRAAGRRCGYCDQPLELPTPLRLWSGAIRKRPSLRGQSTRWAVHLAGNVLFLLLSGWLVLDFEVLHPNGYLERLFLGVALLAWAAVGWFTGRAARLAPMGALGRARDGALAFASIGFFSFNLFLAQEAKPVPETLIATFTVTPSAIQVGDRLLRIPSGEVVVEYLQLDHEVLGYHDIIPLAFVGGQRLAIPHSLATQALIDHLRSNPDDYAARGLTVRHRADRHKVTSGHTYEVVERVGQLLIRRVDKDSLAAWRPGSVRQVYIPT